MGGCGLRRPRDGFRPAVEARPDGPGRTGRAGRAGPVALWYSESRLGGDGATDMTIELGKSDSGGASSGLKVGSAVAGQAACNDSWQPGGHGQQRGPCDEKSGQSQSDEHVMRGRMAIVGAEVHGCAWACVRVRLRPSTSLHISWLSRQEMSKNEEIR